MKATRKTINKEAIHFHTKIVVATPSQWTPRGTYRHTRVLFYTWEEMCLEAFFWDSVVRSKLNSHVVVLRGDNFRHFCTAEFTVQFGIRRKATANLHIIILANLRKDRKKYLANQNKCMKLLQASSILQMPEFWLVCALLLNNKWTISFFTFSWFWKHL